MACFIVLPHVTLHLMACLIVLPHVTASDGLLYSAASRDCICWLALYYGAAPLGCGAIYDAESCYPDIRVAAFCPILVIVILIAS